MKINFKTDVIPSTEAIIELYSSAGLDRPLVDPERITKMYAGSQLVVTAWHEELLIGIARSVTDFCYCCYVSDLAVRQPYKCAGIGKKLIRATKDIVGEGSNLVLLSTPSAMEFYPRIGMEKVDNGFIIKRSM